MSKWASSFRQPIQFRVSSVGGWCGTVENILLETFFSSPQRTGLDLFLRKYLSLCISFYHSPKYKLK